MKHLSWTGDPAITCFSFSPSTDTDGTAVFSCQYLRASNLFCDTYDVQLENLADFRVGRDLAVKVSCVRRVCEFQLQSILTASAEENVNLSNSSID